MRYFTITSIVAFTAVLLFNSKSLTRQPASYPNFVGVIDTTTSQIPETRKLAPPTNGNEYSMKNVEDTFADFKKNYVAIEEQIQLANTRLQHLRKIRDNDPNYNWANAANPLNQEINKEKTRLSYWQGQQQQNCNFALHKINLEYAMIQVGLKNESHARVAELTGFISSALYNSYGTTQWASQQYFIDPTKPTFFDDSQFVTPHYPGTVDRSAEIRNDFIGPQLPSQPQQQDFSGTVFL